MRTLLRDNINLIRMRRCSGLLLTSALIFCLRNILFSTHYSIYIGGSSSLRGKAADEEQQDASASESPLMVSTNSDKDSSAPVSEGGAEEEGEQENDTTTAAKTTGSLIFGSVPYGSIEIVHADTHDEQNESAKINYVEDVSLFDPSYCNGAVSRPLNSSSSLALGESTEEKKKYVIFYPRAGIGNVMLGYASAAIYACLTGRELKIAPPNSREGVFKCNEYFASGFPGAICDELEMSDELIQAYEQSGTVVRSPEAWTPVHCLNNKKDMEHFLCDDGKAEDEFVAGSSCQYYADLFHRNRYFKDRLSPNPYRDIIRGRLRPSPDVELKMVNDVQYHVCIHVRKGVEETAFRLGENWIESLSTCVKNIFNGHEHKDVLLFSHYEDVRNAVRMHLEVDGETTIHFASETSAKSGNHDHSVDEYQGIADMFSMGTKCINLLPSFKDSTYAILSANLMENVQVFPGDRWGEGCLKGSQTTFSDPTGGGVGSYYCDILRNSACESNAQNNSSMVTSPANDNVEIVHTSTLAPSKNPTRIVTQYEDKIDADTVIQSSDTPDYKPVQDDKCKLMFEWSMMDSWQSNGGEFDFSNLPQTKNLRKTRMGGGGAITMSIELRNSQLNMAVVDLTRGMNNLKHPNVWHQMTALYQTWVAVQIAQRKFYLLTNRTVYIHDCNGELSLKWSNLGELSCDKDLIGQADLVIVPPLDGLMWDLAWDFDFQCDDSDMFKAFASLFVDKKSKLVPTEPMGCWISRKESGVRKVANLDALLDMMREIFPRVESLLFTADQTIDQTVDMLRECRVLFGVHGAGHTNAIFARPGVGVVEAIGNARPAYYRNINMLLGQNYQSIIGDPIHGIGDDNYMMDLEEARSALIKARDHAAEWIEKNGHWR